MSLGVSEESVAALLRMDSRLLELEQALERSCAGLKQCWEENQDGLGAHSASIGALIQNLNAEVELAKPVRKLSRRLRRSAHIREVGRKDIYGDSAAPQSPYLAGVLGRIYASGYRKLRTPDRGGSWSGEVFHPDPDSIPASANPEKKTFSQLCEQLKQEYGISYTGTPFVEGFPDFRGIALARVGREELLSLMVRDGRAVDSLVDESAGDYTRFFLSRSVNFRYADEAAAGKQFPLPGLQPGYTRNDLEAWRKKHSFTWEESPIFGYLLVPAAIHNNIYHTGQVALDLNGQEAEQAVTERLRSIRDSAPDGDG